MILNRYIEKQCSVLIVGCGNSGLAEQMNRDGYHKTIVSIDFAPTCIETMKQRALNFRLENLQYHVMDARELSFQDNCFDSIIDKGTLDSTLCGTGSYQNLRKMLNEIYRVLRFGGTFISISFGAPDQRRKHYIRPEYDWSMTETEIRKQKHGKESVHYVFVMVKGHHPSAQQRLQIGQQNSMNQHEQQQNQNEQQLQQQHQIQQQQLHSLLNGSTVSANAKNMESSKNSSFSSIGAIMNDTG
jgi:ubiquinone/menaquinone biosynthesis C-methylase UbiE